MKKPADNTASDSAIAAPTGTRRIRLTAPHIKSVGTYLPGIEYEVDAGEAERLVTVKGFEYTTPPAASTEEK